MANVLCVFAHPDDEAFGPSGTIAKLAQDNNVYIICVTDGDAAFGRGDGSLAKIRREELLKSSKILGVKEVFFFNYADGSLSNNIYHELAEKIKEKVSELSPETLLTFEPHGISGHLDHISVSIITTFVFQREKTVKELWYSAVLKDISEHMADYFIYFPEGYEKSQIDKVVDVSQFTDKKVAAIKAHESQKKDGEMILSMMSSMPQEEYFLVKTKK